jgi:tellurite resistance protein
MAESRDYLEMAFQSIRCFTDDGKLDLGELNRIVAIAEADGVVDDNEKRVLAGIVGRVRAEEVDAAMAARIRELGKNLGMPLALKDA